MNYEFQGNYIKYQIEIKDPATLEPINLDDLNEILIDIFHEQSKKSLAKFSKTTREGFNSITISDPETGIAEIEIDADTTKNAIIGKYIIEVKSFDSDDKPTTDQGNLCEFIDAKLKNINA